MKLKTVLKAFLLGACLISFGGQLNAASNNKIDYVYPDSNARKSANQGAPNKGVKNLLRFADLLFSKAGIPWTATPYPAKRTYLLLRNGAANFSILTNPQNQLKDCCLISTDPITELEVGVYSLGKRPSIKSKEDLIGKSIIAIRGYKYAGIYKFLNAHKSTTRVFYATNRESAFKMLERRRADLFLDYPQGANAFLKDQKDFKTSYNVLLKTGLHLVLHKDYPDAEATLTKLEAIAKKLDTRAILGAAN
jgi:polar amino acid transport system substrate-binding protein